ncbi:MAG: N-acetylmuramate 1-kinase [Acidobacteriota bacterium]|jgi:aminoglycoside/choline kinase family phosphotransferase|nr:N-acetylmuramate 1-kinase [Acidobacteriota bacterium]
MSHPTSITTNAFTASARERIEGYVRRAGVGAGEIVALTPDASTREYFRIPWREGTAVAAVYPEPFDPEVHPFIDVTRLFEAAQLPVPSILEVDASVGVIVQEDLGDRQLRRVFESASEDEYDAYLDRAVCIIADIQAATRLAYERESIASRLAFDEAKLAWELDYFVEHYFKSYRREELKHGDEAQLRAELNDVASELSARPRVLCHRDFHSSNLIVDDQDHLRVIDHQDARMGPASYDLVSLLLDRQTSVPSMAEIRQRRLFFLEERKSRGLEEIAADEFAQEFRLMTVQRCLKACGTFSYQSGVCGRAAVYEQFIQPMLLFASQAAEWLNRFPVLRATIAARVGSSAR